MGDSVDVIPEPKGAGRTGRTVALVLSLFLIAVVSWRFPITQRTVSRVLLIIGLAGQVIAGIIVDRDFRLSFPSEQHRRANVILILIMGNALAVSVYVLLARRRLRERLERENSATSKPVPRPTQTAFPD